MYQLPTDIVFFERGWLSSNNVLLHDSSQAILIDTGYWSHADQTASLVASKLNGRALTSILNTHLHSDHCGGNAHLQHIYKNVQVRIPPGHSAFVDAWDESALTYAPTGQRCPKFTRTGLLNNGDTIDIGNKFWSIRSAPGHDPHSVVLFCEECKILISADALWENGFGVVFPEIEGISAFDEVEATLQMIEELAPKVILPGHGSAFFDVHTALARARSRLVQFRESPEQHALYAAKVLIKFKLLDAQTISLTDIQKWASTVSYLAQLHEIYWKNETFTNWIDNLCIALEKSNACLISDRQIRNI